MYLPEELFDDIVAFLTPHFKLRDDREATLIPILNHWEGYSDIEWEGHPRAFTTRLVEKLPDDLLKLTLTRVPVGVQAQRQVDFLCRRVDEQEQDVTVKRSRAHELHRYPRGPMVEVYRVRRSIIKAYAAAIDPTEAQSAIGEANAFRVEADPDDSTVTLIRPSNLPPPLNAKPFAFWSAVFGEACLHGPRMLAALLLVVPDVQFPADARADRQKLLRSLRARPS